MDLNIPPQEFEQLNANKLVLMKSSHPKIFCSGGDIKDTLKKLKIGDPTAFGYAREQYQLNHLIGTLKKPYVAIIDGYTMGSGIGLSVHAPFRISTENTIGYFPDVGSGFFLPRMDGEIGIYLGLTGARLTGEDALHAGFATHHVQSKQLPELENALISLASADIESVQATIERFSAKSTEKPYSLEPHRAAIDRCFKFECLKEICKALENENTPWAKATLEMLHQMSPTSTQVGLLHLRAARSMSFAEEIINEYDLAQKCLPYPDFCEGVTALLVEKRPAVWSPATIADLSLEHIKQEYFIKRSAEKLVLLNDCDYKQYPYARMGSNSKNSVLQLSPKHKRNAQANL
ncbi:ClpP/crotonase-like domain-containing protein [Syncephalis fuscata]|nr:ClpP/crotonase-like domain-containing protein [Syncephalis fuscata]